MPGSVLKLPVMPTSWRARPPTAARHGQGNPSPARRPIYGQALAIPYSEVARSTPQALLASCWRQGHETIDLKLDGVVLLNARGSDGTLRDDSKSSFHGKAQNDRTQRAGWLAHTDCTNQPRRAVGILPAQIGETRYSRVPARISRRSALIDHDAGWYKYEAQPVYDVATRSTPNFVQVPPDPIQLEAYQWAIDWVSGIDPYAGLLVNRYWTVPWAERYHTVSNPPPPPRRPLSDLIKNFMTHNEARQEHALQSLDRDAFAINYHMLQVWDLLSLYLCGGKREAQTFEPVPTG